MSFVNNRSRYFTANTKCVYNCVNTPGFIFPSPLLILYEDRKNRKNDIVYNNWTSTMFNCELDCAIPRLHPFMRNSFCQSRLITFTNLLHCIYFEYFVLRIAPSVLPQIPNVYIHQFHISLPLLILCEDHENGEIIFTTRIRHLRCFMTIWALPPKDLVRKRDIIFPRRGRIIVDKNIPPWNRNPRRGLTRILILFHRAS